MSCRTIREWLHVDAATLDEAQRLRFEDHLASCAGCRGDRARTRTLREIGEALPVPAPGAREYSRAIARALLEGAPALAPRRRPLWLVPIAIGALAATAAAAVVLTRDDAAPRAPQVAPAPTPRPPAPRLPDPEPAPPVPPEPPAPPPKHVVKKPVAPKPPADVLAQARAQFAAGHHAEAERAVLVYVERSRSRAEQAEAWMFLADLAQATGNLGTAITRYETVATKYADLPAAESALYAAARIETRRGRGAAARALYDRYLERYPSGRYADDVSDQRRQLR